MTLITVLVVADSIAFLYYAFSLLRSAEMKPEFERYGLEHLRTLIGYLQLFGAIGLLIGLRYNIILSAASASLSLLMLMGFIVRIKIKDTFFQSAPSFLFMLLNIYVLVASIKLY